MKWIHEFLVNVRIQYHIFIITIISLPLYYSSIFINLLLLYFIIIIIIIIMTMIIVIIIIIQYKQLNV